MEDPNAVVSAIISQWLAKRGFKKTLSSLENESGYSLQEFIGAGLSEPSMMALFHENTSDVSRRLKQEERSGRTLFFHPPFSLSPLLSLSHLLRLERDISRALAHSKTGWTSRWTATRWSSWPFCSRFLCIERSIYWPRAYRRRQGNFSRTLAATMRVITSRR